MSNFAQEVRNITQNARRIVAERGYCVGEIPLTAANQPLSKNAQLELEREMRHQAHLTRDYYSMVIEPRHQGKPELFDPYDHSPNNKWWPHEEMLASLKGHAKAVADWAKAQGFTVTIADVNSFDPTRKKSLREYHLVISWPEAKAAEKAA